MKSTPETPEPSPPPPPAAAPMSRIDGLPYRHRLKETMVPALTGSVHMTLAQAVATMDRERRDCTVVTDQRERTIGIVTQQDVLHWLSVKGAAALDLELGTIMSAPVRTVPEDAFLYVGIGRMARLGMHHLVVVDAAERPLGVITGYALLRWRASRALAIGDEVSVAESAADLGACRRRLPRLARELLADQVPARDIAAVISAMLRDITARAAILSESALLADGWGPAPARWALLVLGSGGRGESLLNFDQDNAIVHEGGPDDDSWYAEFGRRLNDILNEAGIPYCHGEVMARNPFWRRSLEGWKSEIRDWVFEPQLQSVLNVDIFFDFVAVHGDFLLAEELHDYAVETAARSAFFIQFLAINMARLDVPLGLFGQLKTVKGRLNAKKFGLLPLVSAARAKAVAAGRTERGTAERFGALAAAGLIHADDLSGILDAHETFLTIILDQQLADLDQNLPPSAEIEPRKLSYGKQRRLKSALQRIRLLKTLSGGLMAS